MLQQKACFYFYFFMITRKILCYVLQLQLIFTKVYYFIYSNDIRNLISLTFFRYKFKFGVKR